MSSLEIGSFIIHFVILNFVILKTERILIILKLAKIRTKVVGTKPLQLCRNAEMSQYPTLQAGLQECTSELSVVFPCHQQLVLPAPTSNADKNVYLDKSFMCVFVFGGTNCICNEMFDNGIFYGLRKLNGIFYWLRKLLYNQKGMQNLLVSLSSWETYSWNKMCFF